MQLFLDGVHLPTSVQVARLQEASGDLSNKVIAPADYIQTLAEYPDSERKRDIDFNYQLYYTNGTLLGS